MPALPAELPDNWTPRTLATFRRRLLRWFDTHRRDLPWRTDRDPYRIWVSEVMLQQTTVAAVIPYYTAFLKSFPDVYALAAADEQVVLRHWEGLGYYRRARHLHATARIVVSEHNGRFPHDPDAWSALPGVGRYICGAVLSQAFEQRMPIVEANSLRVLSRLFGYTGDPRNGEGRKWVWKAAEDVLPSKRVGDFNQAMMELGALVCAPGRPDCGSCPVAGHCSAYRSGTQLAIPPSRKPPSTVSVQEAAIAIRRHGKFLVGRRAPDSTRWANLWAFPHGPIRFGESIDDAAIRIAETETGLTIRPLSEFARIRHRVTRFAIDLWGIEAESTGGRIRTGHFAEFRWAAPSELADLPTGTAQRKLFQQAIRRRTRRLF